jgi:hypothetical protein
MRIGVFPYDGGSRSLDDAAVFPLKRDVFRSRETQ